MEIENGKSARQKEQARKYLYKKIRCDLCNAEFMIANKFNHERSNKHIILSFSKEQIAKAGHVKIIERPLQWKSDLIKNLSEEIESIKMRLTALEGIKKINDSDIRRLSPQLSQVSEQADSL